MEARLRQLTVVNIGLALPTSVAINTRAVEGIEPVLSAITRESIIIIHVHSNADRWKTNHASVGKECSQLLSQLFFRTPTRQTGSHVVVNAHCMSRIFYTQINIINWPQIYVWCSFLSAATLTEKKITQKTGIGSYN